MIRRVRLFSHSNLTIACHPCNDTKGTRPLETFLTQDPERRWRAAQNARRYAGKDPSKQKERAKWEAERFDRIQRQRQVPLKDAAMR